jgi:hypothetical protein
VKCPIRAKQSPAAAHDSGEGAILGASAATAHVMPNAYSIAIGIHQPGAIDTMACHHVAPLGQFCYNVALSKCGLPQ